MHTDLTVDVDGHGTPTIWAVEVWDDEERFDEYPEPVLSITDLSPSARKWWPLFVRRLVDFEEEV